MISGSPGKMFPLCNHTPDVRYLLTGGMILWIAGIILVFVSVVSNEYLPELIGISLLIFSSGFFLIFCGIALTISECPRKGLVLSGVCSILLFFGIFLVTDGFSRSGIAASVIGFTIIFFICIAFLADGIHTLEKRKADNPLITRLLEEFEKIPDKTTYSSPEMQELKKKCENWAIRVWQEERNLDISNNQLLDDLFLYLDHLENFSGKETGNEKIPWAYKRMINILNRYGIEDLRPDSTTEFTPEFHVCVGEKRSGYRRGTILNVSRRGYMKRSQSSGSPVVLRRAEVIVSSGEEPETKKPEEDRGTSDRN